MSSAEYSFKFFKPVFAYRQTCGPRLDCSWSGSTLFAKMTFKTKQTTIAVIGSLRVNTWGLRILVVCVRVWLNIVCDIFVLNDVFFFFFVFFFFGGGGGVYGPFKNISLISSRSFIKGGRKPENPGKNNLTIRKQNLAFPHVTRARLEPQLWET